MMGIKDRSFSALPHDISLEELVPKGQLLPALAEHAGPLLREGAGAPLYAGAGRPSVDPVVFFKLQLVMFFEDLRSERQLMSVVADRLCASLVSRIRSARAPTRPLQPNSHPRTLRS